MILRNNLITNLGYGWKDVQHWLVFCLQTKTLMLSTQSLIADKCEAETEL